MVDKIANATVARVRSGQVLGAALLMRANWDCEAASASVRVPEYAGQTRMRFRPWWSQERKAQPIHNSSGMSGRAQAERRAGGSLLAEAKHPTIAGEVGEAVDLSSHSELAHLAGCFRPARRWATHERLLVAAVLEDAAERHRPALAARLRRDAMRTRNRIIFELGAKYFADGSLRARAAALIAAARAYEQGEWRHHRALAAPPDCIVGTARKARRVFKSGPFPFGERTVEGIR